MARPVERERVERRLAAILMADVVGYSRLMGTDDEGTLARLKAHYDALVAPKIKEHRGRIVRTMGDGLLVIFASVVDAVHCAVNVQRGMAERNAQVSREQRIVMRIGIHFGDIIIDGRNVHGDGVNVTARLEALAEPGGICVSSRVREDVQNKFDVAFEDAGEQQLKNIARPVRVYRVNIGGATTSAASPADNPSFPGAMRSRKPADSHDEGDKTAARNATPLRFLATYIVTPVVLLLLAHYLLVMKLDVDTGFLRAFSLVLPMLVGFALFRRTGFGLGAAFLLGATTAVVSVLGMLAIVRFVDSSSLLPSTPFEWQEALEYLVGITLATMFGSLLARTVTVHNVAQLISREPGIAVDQILPGEIDTQASKEELTVSTSGKVFICYRRDDVAGHAGRVHDRLQAEFGRDLLFMDVDSVPLGIDFVKHLREAVAKCEVLLVVIGANWLDARDERGARRLDDPTDFVRIEIGTALQREINVVPILLEGTGIPKPDQLPSDLAGLAHRQGLEIRHVSFDSDIKRLITALRSQLVGSRTTGTAYGVGSPIV
jgi:class 3 adenylate cyclase